MSFEDMEKMIQRVYGNENTKKEPKNEILTDEERVVVTPEDRLTDPHLEIHPDNRNEILTDEERVVVTPEDRLTDPHLEIHPGPKTPENRGIGEASQEELNTMIKGLSNENKAYAKAMTPEGQSIASKLFGFINNAKTEGITGTLAKLVKPKSIDTSLPSIDTNNIFAKIDIFSDSIKLWLKEGPASKVGKEVTKYNMQIAAVEESINEIQQDIKQAESGAEKEAYELQLRKLIVKKNRLEERRNPLQSEYEGKTNQIKEIVNHRDAIAQDMQNRYGLETKRLDSQLQILESKNEQINTDAEKMQANHQQQEAIITEMEKRIMEKETKMKELGFSDKEIKEQFKMRRTKIAQYRDAMRLQQKGLEKRRQEIGGTIAEKDAQASGPRNKQRYFANVMLLRPVFNSDVTPLEPIGKSPSREKIQSHPA